jgi:circadian clock protein KaiC
VPKTQHATRELRGIRKCPTGIQGLDEILEGGLPKGRTSLVCGGAGCGKTLLAMEFIAHGIVDYGEPGVFVSFEEPLADLAENVASLGIDVPGLKRRKLLGLDEVRVERGEIEETGEYDLEGLFVRLGSLIDEVRAKRVALDTIDSLFAGLPNHAILRSELRRLFRWLKERGVTSIVTAEQGEGTLTRHGLEEYVSDCVIQLDHRVRDHIATRRLRVVKYRGTAHRTNEYPAMIDSHGLNVLPISSLGLGYSVSGARVSTGVKRLDGMLSGRGYFRGSSILVSGSAGTGKTSLAVAFADSICRTGQKCLYIAFEESAAQLMRNMKSIGFDLKRWSSKGLLHFRSQRVTMYGLENHLANLHAWVDEFSPSVVVMDPVTSLVGGGGQTGEVEAMLIRTIDFLKARGITAFFTTLSKGGLQREESEVSISSLIDTWLHLRIFESGGERTRGLVVIKSRGMAHSNQVREFLITDTGLNLRDVYVGSGKVLMGSAREVQETQDQQVALEAKQGFERRQRELGVERQALEAQIEAIRLRLNSLQGETKNTREREQLRIGRLSRERTQLRITRKAD